MLETDSNYGLLLTKDIKLHRKYFKEMCKLIGIKVVYYPTYNKDYTTYTEIINDKTCKPMVIGCIFEEHPTQQTMKKIGWVSELQESASIIHVDYDLPNLQQGSLFVIPSGIDKAQGRLFRVSRLTNSIVYPATITCEIVPEYENTFSNSQLDFKHSDFNVLYGEEIDN